MAKRDQIVEQCTRIMGDPDRIRNMAIAAHVDHGKSVPAETMVRLSDGTQMTAEALFERFRQGGQAIDAFDGDAYTLESPPSIQSYDKDSGEFDDRDVAYAAVHRTELLYEVTVSDDRSVRVTPEHPFLTMDADGTFAYRRAGTLSEGATIVAHGSVAGEPNATPTIEGGSGVAALHERRIEADSVSFVTVDAVERVETDELVYDFGVEETRNFIAEGLVVHNTTLSDHLLAGAGMMPENVAGEGRQMDTEEDEQERGITIDAANVSMTHTYNDEEFLINLIDTPGHVDFGGDVTRAMRAVDGVLILVDAVDGVMPQTETVVRQAMREGVKPTLFINKVDRLINELQEGPEQVQERMQEIIGEVNDLIRGLKPDHIEENWQVSVADGTVAFGSALRGWALTAPLMETTGVKFGQINEWELNGRGDELADEIPAETAVLDMVIEHFPSPANAQGRRIDTIWQGDPDSDIGQKMENVESDGDTVFMVTDIGVDEHSGEIATGRVFSGTLRSGDEVYINGVAGTSRINSVGIIMGDERETVDGVPAGNIAAVTGLDKAIAGSTVSSIEMTPFEGVDHISEPVITKSIEPERMGDLDDLRGVLQQVSKEDPTIRVQYDEDTGESLISGQGELHLEVVTDRIEDNQGIPIKTGDPIVIYRERPSDRSDEVEIRTSNGLNDFVFSIEPLPQDAVDAIKDGDVSMNMPDLDRREVLQEAGVEKEATQEIEDIVGTTIFADVSKGVQRLDEVMDHVVSGVEEATESGPLAGEPVEGVLVRLHDATIHEDPAHRGPAEIIPAVRQAVHGALLDGQIYLYEPMQNVRIDVPSEHMGSAMGEITSRRGDIGPTEQEAGQAVVNGSAPVEEMLGFSNDIRSVTDGRASWNTENSGFSQVPANLQRDVIQQIRERKGMKTELPDAADYL